MLNSYENLLRIAEITNVPYSYLIDVGRDNEDDIGSMAVRDRLFQEDNMFTRVRSFAQSEKLSETYQAVQYMRVHHAGQVRDKAKYSTEDLLLEVTSMADKIFLSFMQLIKETKYVNAYRQVLNEMGISYKKRGPFRNIRPKHKLPTS